MPWFAVSLLFECHIAGTLPADPMRELAVHLVAADDEAEARARGADIGAKRQHGYPNGDGEDVTWLFRGVAECQELLDRELADGMEVSSWIYRGGRLVLNEGWEEGLR